MTEFLNEQSYELEEYDEQLVGKLIERITIHDAKISIELSQMLRLI